LGSNNNSTHSRGTWGSSPGRRGGESRPVDRTPDRSSSRWQRPLSRSQSTSQSDQDENRYDRFKDSRRQHGRGHSRGAEGFGHDYYEGRGEHQAAHMRGFGGNNANVTPIGKKGDFLSEGFGGKDYSSDEQRFRRDDRGRQRRGEDRHHHDQGRRDRSRRGDSRESDGISLFLHDVSKERPSISADEFILIEDGLNSFINSSLARTRDCKIMHTGVQILAADEQSVVLLNNWAKDLNVNNRRFNLWRRGDNPSFTVRFPIPPSIRAPWKELWDSAVARAGLDVSNLAEPPFEGGDDFGRHGGGRKIVVKCDAGLLRQIREHERRFPGEPRPFSARLWSLGVRYGDRATVVPDIAA
jgi:hypothetical protein